MEYLWLAAGVLIGGPIWIGLMMLAARRVWRTARRMAARTRRQEHLAELGQLAGGLAHEIKNPLSTVEVNLKLLSEDLSGRPDDESRRMLRRLKSVQEEVNRLRGNLEDFLRYAGKMELSASARDLRGVVGELVDFFSPQAQAAGVVLRTSLPDQPAVCLIDGDLIKQALLNLLINAVQAMEQGGELLIRVSAAAGRAILEVIDTGPGIEPESLERIFQVYYSTTKGGSGLGLPTTRRIIHEHDGGIRVESERGKGTRFIIDLPLAGPADTKVRP
ncbi:MAG: two-component sensor histidine kinase [Planctomycetes bacterium]|nr:two-component sensor histidine kinase [Planctomycetota bacterium]